MRLNLTADDVLTTTRSVRKRLDFDKPVSRAVLMECLDIALQAPTGSNAQGWQWMFVLDLPKPERGDIRDQQMDAVMTSATYLNENLHHAPVMLIPILEGRPDSAPIGVQASYWGSILPAVWSFMLALRERGLGTAWTTLHLMGDGERQAAELLGIPFDGYTQAGLFPIADTKGTDFKLAKRLPAEQLTHWDTW